MNLTPSLSKSAVVFRQLSCSNPTSPLSLTPKGARFFHPLATYQANHRTAAAAAAQAKLRSLSHLRYYYPASSFSSSSSSSSKPSPPKERGRWKRNGTPELIIGFTILTLVGIDQFLQSKHRKHRQDVTDQLRLAVHVDALEEKKNGADNEWIGGARAASSSSLGEKLALFSCVVRRIPKLFDGNKSLMNVHIGDKVDILEENVGPDGMYHFCRLKRECEGGIGHDINDDHDDHDGDSDNTNYEDNNHYFNFGWFPISCLEKEP